MIMVIDDDDDDDDAYINDLIDNDDGDKDDGPHESDDKEEDNEDNGNKRGHRCFCYRIHPRLHCNMTRNNSPIGTCKSRNKKSDIATYK